MNIFFDVDSTIHTVDFAVLRGALRPRVREVFQQLKSDGASIYIWSGAGVRWSVVHNHGLEPFVSGVYEKPLQDYVQEVDARLRRRELPVRPDLVVDDYPEFVAVFGGIVVAPYSRVNEQDREMDQVYRIVRDYRLTGTCAHPAFHPVPPTT